MKNTLLLFLLFSGFNTQAQITDIDGNSYDTVRIGDQTWMAENLNVSRFQNGDVIPEAKSEREWVKAGENKQPAWCYYNNDPSNSNKFGKLYNWYAVNDSRGLAPEGWHVAYSGDWSWLIENLGGIQINDYLSPFWFFEEGEYEINLITSGTRNINGDGKFYYPKENDIWWNAPIYDSAAGDNAFSKFSNVIESDGMQYNSNVYYFVTEECGFSVRCVKD